MKTAREWREKNGVNSLVLRSGDLDKLLTDFRAEGFREAAKFIRAAINRCHKSDTLLESITIAEWLESQAAGEDKRGK